jgi:YggT family protein
LGTTGFERAYDYGKIPGAVSVVSDALIQPLTNIVPLLARLIDLYSFVVLAAVILSWTPLDRRNPLVAIVYTVTEPVLVRIRKVLPPMGGLDFSPMVLLIGLQVLKALFV